MSGKYFKVVKHVVPGQHIRRYPHATLNSDSDVLRLAVKQYIPLTNQSPQPGDVTIIGTHANGFPKELYEPLWDELLHRSAGNGIRIAQILIADVVHQGASYALNEDIVSNAPSWFDHPLDLLQIVNHFRPPPPLVGIGHSWGGAQLAQVSLIHPRLFSTLVLIDPVIAAATSRKGNMLPSLASTFRRDLWPSREQARESFAKNKFYQTWDPRVLEAWVEHGLRSTPTRKHPSAPAGSVTLATPKDQEVLTFLRPANLPNEKYGGKDFSEADKQRLQEILYPEIPPTKDSPQALSGYPLYRTEPSTVFHDLPKVRPSTIYIFGSDSPVSPVEQQETKVSMTGTAVGGSGGVAKGRVKGVVVPKTGHLVPMEEAGKTADIAAEWIGKQLVIWREDQELLKRWRSVESDEERVGLSKQTLDIYNKLRDEVSKQSKGSAKL